MHLSGLQDFHFFKCGPGGFQEARIEWGNKKEDNRGMGGVFFLYPVYLGDHGLSLLHTSQASVVTDFHIHLSFVLSSNI